MPHNLTGTRPAAGRQRASRRARAPHGFTLLEMLLVLTLLSIVALLVTPSLVGLQRRQQFKQAAMTVLSRLAAARVNAAEHGVPYEFWFEPNGRRYLLLPGRTPTVDNARQTADRHVLPTYICVLPEEAVFAADPGAAESPVPLDPDRLRGLPGSGGLDRAPWTRPITFYPDGTGTRAAFRVIGRRGDVMYFRVNRLTGTVKATSNP